MEKTQGEKQNTGKAEGYKNLVPFAERSEEEQREIRRKGGIASGESRRKTKETKAMLEMLLAKVATEDQKEAVLGECSDMVQGDLTWQALISAKLILKAAQGDTYAFQLIRDSIGDKPIERSEVKQDITAADLAMVEKVKNRLKIDVS